MPTSSEPTELHSTNGRSFSNTRAVSVPFVRDHPKDEGFWLLITSIAEAHQAEFEALYARYPAIYDWSLNTKMAASSDELRIISTVRPLWPASEKLSHQVAQSAKERQSGAHGGVSTSEYVGRHRREESGHES